MSSGPFGHDAVRTQLQQEAEERARIDTIETAWKVPPEEVEPILRAAVVDITFVLDVLRNAQAANTRLYKIIDEKIDSVGELAIENEKLKTALSDIRGYTRERWNDDEKLKAIGDTCERVLVVPPRKS